MSKNLGASLESEPGPQLWSYSAPGKVILLGEYAVLTGLPALVAAIAPRFLVRVESRNSPSAEHPRSPLGRLRTWAQKQGWPELSFHFLDPFHGAGGFGASTAQFVLAYSAYIHRLRADNPGLSHLDGTPLNLNWEAPLALYRQLMSDEALVPSGADLVAQWEGGIVHFNPEASSCVNLAEGLDGASVLVFSATGLPGRKVPTHEHLALLAQLGFPQAHSKLLKNLGQITEQGVLALKQKNSEKLGQAFDEYAESLQQAQLEVPGATEDRKALRELPAVLGVKGAGALQSDALLVIMDSSPIHRKHLIQQAQLRGLALVCNGILPQKGIQECSKRSKPSV